MLSVSEYVAKRFAYLISADRDQTLGSLLKNLVVMKRLTKTLSALPQFQVTSKIYEKVCWMFVMPTYDTIATKDFYNRCSQLAGNVSEIWNYFKNNAEAMDKLRLQSSKFNAGNAQQESTRLIRFLTRKCAEITAEACEIQERLSQIASELSPGDLSGHFNSFSSINDSSESHDDVN